VAVGKYVAVGGRGWKGVAVAVAFAGLNRKFGFMLTAAGAAKGAIGKLQAKIKLINANKMIVSLVRM